MLRLARNGRFTGSQVHRFTGSRVHRFTGSQVHRFMGSRVHRFTGSVALVVVGALAGTQVTGQPEGPAAARVDPYTSRARVVVMTDIANEPDDQMSLVRFLVYANHFDVEGLVATTSTWMKTRVRPDVIHTLLTPTGACSPPCSRMQQGFPAADALRTVVVAGQPGYGMAAVGADRMSAGAELIVRAADRDRQPAAVGPGVGRRQHAGAGAAARARHQDAVTGGRPGRAAARLRHLGSGRRRAVAAPRVPGAALHRDAVHAGRRGVRRRDVDRHQRRSVLQERAGRRLHDVHRRVGERERSRGRARWARCTRTRAAFTRATRRRS